MVISFGDGRVKYCMWLVGVMCKFYLRMDGVGLVVSKNSYILILNQRH